MDEDDRCDYCGKERPPDEEEEDWYCPCECGDGLDFGGYAPPVAAAIE